MKKFKVEFTRNGNSIWNVEYFASSELNELINFIHELKEMNYKYDIYSKGKKINFSTLQQYIKAV